MDREAEASITGKVAFNTLVQVAGKVIVFASAVVLTSILTRFLGQEGYGDYTIVFAYLGVATLFIDFGIQTIAVREVSLGKHGMEEMVRNVFTLKALSAAWVLLLWNLLIFLLPYSRVVKFGVLIASLGAWLGAMGVPPAVVFQARLQMHYVVIMEVLARLVTLVLSALLVFVHPVSRGNQVSVFYALIAVNVVASGLSVLAGYGFLYPMRVKATFNTDLIRRVLSQAIPLAMVIVLSEALFRLDTIILSVLRPSSEVGLYGLAHKVLDLVRVFPGLFMASVFPILSSYVESDKPRFALAVQKSFDLMVVTGIPMVAGGLLLAPGIIHLLGGEDFAGSILPLQILIWAALFNFITSVFTYVMISQGHQDRVLWVSLLGTALSISLGLVFIPLHGYLAAAVVTTFAEFVRLLCLGYLAFQGEEKSLSLGIIPKAILASLIMTVFLILLPGNILTDIVSGAIFYFLALYSLRGFDKETIALLIRASRDRTS